MLSRLICAFLKAPGILSLSGRSAKVNVSEEGN